MKNKVEPLSSKNANQLAYGDCPDCASPLHIKFVGKSSFLGCTGYPECDYSQALNQNTVTVIKYIESSECPKCSKELAVKKGRFGMFIGCTNFPECDFISTKKNPDQRREGEGVACPKCDEGILQAKQNRFGKTFYACSGYPKCKFIANHEPVAKTCPNCGANILYKKSKTDASLVCAEQDCHYSCND
ncbi:DNA topoisomerase family protein [Glaciecola petra]|uniref:Topoisomerase DNA-binding C4 zinc finger domain-containing protein n=1 Tax=Glaciecola petra TaxID=3075602 RepID=A0ABU2ZQV8_9ALTE|nr:topoisomerase DNA-binding C4 zinc finger domain-containing protein [Aestuariibacter sp. P117]MDT0594785.1 topoisomerase DNA-binding C4 zinc finger domain-containing protein [Aestuariibacter sp. P117]